MKRIMCLLAIVISVNYVVAQNLEIYDGYIGKFPITVFLNLNNNKVSGYYLYKEFGQPILLQGEINNSKITLKEFSTGNGKRDPTESAKLIWSRNNASNGQWVSKSRSLTLNLNRRKLLFDWKLFDIKVTLTHTLANHKVHEYPVTLEMIYPEEEDKILFNNLAADIFELRPEFNSILEYFNNFLKKIYNYYLIDFPDEKAPDYYYEMNGKVVFLSESVLSYEVSGYGFAGGAHGQPIEDYYVFDTQKGIRLFFDDIFKVNSELPIARIIHEKDNRKHSIKDIADNLNNFYQTGKGIGFVFNPYDIDCYGCGTFEYFIKFDEISDLLK